jgi:hypothetical protein
VDEWLRRLFVQSSARRKKDESRCRTRYPHSQHCNDVLHVHRATDAEDYVSLTDVNDDRFEKPPHAVQSAHVAEVVCVANDVFTDTVQQCSVWYCRLPRDVKFRLRGSE